MKINWQEHIYLQLFQSFFKVGLMSIGGGYVMLPMIKEEVVDKRDWCTEEEVYEFYTLGQSLPGMISVNTATLIGHKLKGYRGAAVATLGMVLPSLVIIMIVASFFRNIKDNVYVRGAFEAIRAAVVAIIGSAVVSMAKKNVENAFGVILVIVSFVLVYILGVSPLYIILGGLAIGVAYACYEGGVKK